MAAERSRFRRRRFWVAAACAFALGVAAWLAIERAIEVERYRPLVEKELARATGLPASVGRLDLAWRPIPCLSAIDVTLGEGDFQLQAERVDLFPAVHALLWRRVEIPRIALVELVLTLPEDPAAMRSAWEETWAHLQRAFAGDDGPDSGWSVEVRRVRVPDAALRLGAAAEPLLLVDVAARGIETDELELDIALEHAASEVGAEGTLTVPLRGGASGEGLRGSFEVGPVRPQLLADLPEVLHATWQGEVELSEGDGGALHLDLAGDFEPDAADALGGTFTGRATVGGSAPPAATLRVETPDLALDADGQWVDGALALEALRAGPLSLHGRVAPAEGGGIRLALAGALRLEDGWLHALGAPEVLRDVRGEVALDAIEGVVPPAPDREPLVVRAQLSDAAVRVVSEDRVLDELSAISLRLSSRERRIWLEGDARSRELGPVTLGAALDPDAASAQGHVSFDAQALASYVSDRETRARLAPLLASYGQGRLGFSVAPDEREEGAWRLALERAEPPRLDAVLALSSEGDEVLRDVEASAEVPARALRGFLPSESRTSGSAQVTLRRSGTDRRFAARADLTGFGFASGDFVEKLPGEALALLLEGGGDDGAWTPRRLEVASAEDSASFALEGGGLVAPDLDLDLGDWTFLLVRSARVSGRVRGALDTGAPSAQLLLESVGLHLGGDVGVDAIDGAVALQGDDWSVRDLRVRGAQSDATLTATLADGHLEGALRGASLDIDFVRELLGEVDALRDGGPGDGAPSSISGQLAVELERVGFGRGEVSDLRAQVAMQEGDIAVRDLSFHTYEGVVTGSGDIDARAGEPSQLSFAVAFEKITGRFLDDVLFDPPRDTKGQFTGELRFAAPLADDVKAMLAQGDGSLTATARKGSFGKYGLASRIVTALRATDALRLRVPAFSDEGLVFDTTTAELVMQQGRLEVKDLHLDARSYAIDVGGYADFRQDESDLPIEVNAIKGVSSFVSWIPVAGDALQMVNVRLVATGSPWDLQVGVASFSDQLLGAGRAGANAVVKDARSALRLLRGAGAKEAGEAPAEEEGSAPGDDEGTPDGAPIPEDEESASPEAEPASS